MTSPTPPRPGPTNWAEIALWGVLVLTLASSMFHLASSFGSLEEAGHAWRGWLPAVAVDAGLVAAAYAIRRRRMAGRSATWLYAGVGVFVTLSAFANIDHGMTVAAQVQQVTFATFRTLDGWQLAKVLLLAGSLPGLIFLVIEAISDNLPVGGSSDRADDQPDEPATGSVRVTEAPANPALSPAPVPLLPDPANPRPDAATLDTLRTDGEAGSDERTPIPRSPISTASPQRPALRVLRPTTPPDRAPDQARPLPPWLTDHPTEMPPQVTGRGQTLTETPITPASSISSDPSVLADLTALLRYLRDHPTASQGQTAKALDRPKSTVGGWIRRLDEAGVIDRSSGQMVVRVEVDEWVAGRGRG